MNQHDSVVTTRGRILTGESVPIMGRRVDPDSIAKPQSTPLQSRPEVTFTPKNVFQVGKPKVIPIPKELPVIIPGENGIPKPKTIPARPKVIPAIQPKPVFALPLKMKEKAVGNIKSLSISQGLGSALVHCILEDSRNNLWFGTAGGGVSRYDPDDTRTGGNFTHLTTEQGLSVNSVSSILEDRSGKLWFGKEAKSEVSFYNGLSLTDYSLSEVVIYNTITSMLEDEQDNLWFAVHGGRAVRYTPSDSSYYTYTTTDGLISNHVRSIAQDKQNYIWMNTTQGLSVLIPQSNDSPNATRDYDIFNFGAADGVKTAAFGFRNMCIDQKNQLWWAMDNGVGRLDLNHLELPVDTPKVRLDYVEINQTFVDFRRLSDSSYRQSLPFEEKLAKKFDSIAAFYNYPLHMVLPYDLNHLTFHFAAIDWNLPGQLNFTYLVEGLDKTWSPLNSEGKADIATSPPVNIRLK